MTDAASLIRREAREAGPYAVDWVLQVARFFVVISEGRLTSKTEGALWAEKHAKGSWRHCPADCSTYRKDASYRSRGVQGEEGIKERLVGRESRLKKPKKTSAAPVEDVSPLTGPSSLGSHSRPVSRTEDRPRYSQYLSPLVLRP